MSIPKMEQKMNLEHIEDQVCPTCKSSVREEGRKNQHCNGDWNEFRRFECGHAIIYTPNFRRTEIERQCSKHPQEVIRVERRREARRKLRRYIGRLTVDDDFRSQLYDELESFKYE